MRRALMVLMMAILALVVASCGSSEPYEPTVEQQQAVIDGMTTWYLRGGQLVPSDVEILASADEACDTIRDEGMLWWATIDIAYSSNPTGWAAEAQWEALTIAETEYCPAAMDSYVDYLNS